MWKIIKYQENKKNEMIDMTVEYYGKKNDISDEKFIEHQYFKNPEGNAYIDFAYDFENMQMAGQYMVIPRMFYINSNVIKGVLSLNTLTKESYRGQGVFTKLADAVYEDAANDGVKFCYGAPNQNSFPGFVKKLKFSHIGDVPLYLKITNPCTLIMEKVFKYDKLNQQLIDKSFEIQDNNIIEITKNNVDLLSVFLGRVNKKYKIMGIRNKSFLTWRYFDLPRRNYRIYAYKNGDTITAYAVIRITKVAEMNCGMIVDFLYDDGHENDAISLVNKLISMFKKCNIGLVGCLMLNHTAEAKILKQTHFFVCPKKLLPQPFPIIVREFKSLDEDFFDFSKWFFTMGDYDAI